MSQCRILTIRCLLLSLLLFSGCVSSQHPLSPPGEQPLDPALAGTWYFANDEGQGYFHIQPVDPKTYELIMVSFEKGRPLDVDRFTFHSTALGEHRLINLQEDRKWNEKGENDAPPSAEKGDYQILLYTIEGTDRLYFHFISSAETKKAIEEGTIAGTVKRDLFTSIRITDTPENLRAWIMRAGVEKVFCEPINDRADCKMGPWMRIEPPEGPWRSNTKPSVPAPLPKTHSPSPAVP